MTEQVYTEMSVVFEDVRFHRATKIPKEGMYNNTLCQCLFLINITTYKSVDAHFLLKSNCVQVDHSFCKRQFILIYIQMDYFHNIYFNIISHLCTDSQVFSFSGVSNESFLHVSSFYLVYSTNNFCLLLLLCSYVWIQNVILILRAEPRLCV